jgi:hypothetical protein
VFGPLRVANESRQLRNDKEVLGEYVYVCEEMHNLTEIWKVHVLNNSIAAHSALYAVVARDYLVSVATLMQ